jgi:hypothetical protein
LNQKGALYAKTRRQKSNRAHISHFSGSTGFLGCQPSNPLQANESRTPITQNWQETSIFQGRFDQVDKRALNWLE